MKCDVCGIESADIAVVASDWAPVSWGKCLDCRAAGKEPPGCSREEAMDRSKRLVPAGTPEICFREVGGKIEWYVNISDHDNLRFDGFCSWGDGKTRITPPEDQLELDESVVESAEGIAEGGEIPIDVVSVKAARAEIERRKAERRVNGGARADNAKHFPASPRC